jgi:hypothetical protein
MDERHPIGDTELRSTTLRLRGEQWAEIDAGADDAMIACPGAEHLPRAAAEIQHPGSRFQTQCAPSVASFSGVNGLWMR